MEAGVGHGVPIRACTTHHPPPHGAGLEAHEHRDVSSRNFRPPWSCAYGLQYVPVVACGKNALCSS